jgi:hypothetical protein
MSTCAHCGKKDATVSCEYCKDVCYCNSKCAEVGWHAHANNCNVVEVPLGGMTAFVPTYGEEHFDEQMQEKLNPNGPVFQSYIVQPPTSGASSTLVEAQANFSKGRMRGAGGAPVGELADREFFLRITSKPDPFSDAGKEVRESETMKVRDAAIYATADGVRGRLAKGRFLSTDGTKVTLWPGALSRPMRIPATTGAIMVEMVDKATGYTISSIHGAYNFHKRAGGLIQVFKRGFKTLLPFQSEFKEKNGNGGSNLASLEMLRAADVYGNSTQITFEVMRDSDGVAAKEVVLVDVEFSLWNKTELQPQLPPRDQEIGTHLRLDADNLNHVTALVMAMEDQKIFDEQFQVIKAHQQALEAAVRDGTDYETSPKTYASVELATQEMVGRTYSSKKRYMTKLNRGMFLAIKEAVELYEEMADARNAPSKIRAVTLGKKKAIRRQKKTLESAIATNLANSSLDIHERDGLGLARDILVKGIDGGKSLTEIYNTFHDTNDVVKREMERKEKDLYLKFSSQ